MRAPAFPFRYAIAGLMLCLAGLAQSAEQRQAAAPADAVRLQPGAAEVRVSGTDDTAVQREQLSLLVEFVDSGQDAAKAATARTRVRELTRSIGGKVRHEFRLLPNVMYLRDVPRLRVRDVEAIPGVRRIHENYTFHASLNGSVPLIHGLQSQLISEGLFANGNGVRICIVDTGIDLDHILYASRIDLAASIDLVDDDGSPPADGDGHGSHVAGIAAGAIGFVDFSCGGEETFQGVAPEATLISARVLGDTGSGSLADIMMGIEHCADPDLPGGPADVINLSLGGGDFGGVCDGDLSAQMANAAVDAGVVVVAASGNDGQALNLDAPACGSKVIAVGASWDGNYPECDLPQTSFVFNDAGCTDTNPTIDQIGCYSNGGNQLDVVAPGCAIWSVGIASPTTLVPQCGTSMASPHVAGLAALLLSFNPALTPAEVRQLIRDGAEDLGIRGFDTTFGHGRIDVMRSLQLLQPCDSDTDCDDGVFCNGDEVCDDSICRRTERACDDGVDCTVDRCDPALDSCVSEPLDQNCNDGDLCTGVEVCDASDGCISAEPLDCDDGIGCTVDRCFALAGCNHTVDALACQNETFCDGVESCSLTEGCLPGLAPLPDGTSCSDGGICGGEQTCLAGACVGDPLPDSDGDETCDEIDNCPRVSNAEQANSDSDRFGDACDCSPEQGELWALPGEAYDMRLSHSGGTTGATLLAWAAPLDSGGESSAILSYEKLLSASPQAFVDAGSCFGAADDPDTQSMHSDNPTVGEVFYFLVRARNDCGHGALGIAALGERTGPICP